MRKGSKAPNKIPMLRKKFGSLKVVSEKPRNKWGERTWKCLCRCGVTCIRAGHSLRRGQITHCGCLTGKEKITHGKTGTKIYQLWASMIARCHSKSDCNYKNYGAKGIKVCKRWRESFENFYSDVGDPPFKRATMDRVNNTKGYSLKNFRWASYSVQSRNKSTNKFFTLNRVTKCVADWAKVFGIDRSSMCRRLQRYGTVEFKGKRKSDIVRCGIKSTKMYEEFLKEQTI